MPTRRAIGYCDQALEALEHLPADPQRRFTLLSRRLRAEERQGDYERMTASLAEMEDVARAAGDDAVLAGALLNRGRFLRMVGPIPEAVTTLEECVRLSEHLGRLDLLASALVERGLVYMARLRNREALADMERALTIYRGGDFPSGVERQIQHAAALRALGQFYNRLGHIQAALDVLEESLALLQALPQTRLDEVALTRMELGWALQITGASQRAAQVFTEALETIREIDLSGVMVEAHLLGMLISMEAGEQNLTIEEAHISVHELDRAGRWQNRPDIKGNRLALLAWEEFDKGHPDLALIDGRLALAQFRQIGELHLFLLFMPVLVYIHVALGQVEAALDVSAQALHLMGGEESYGETSVNFRATRR